MLRIHIGRRDHLLKIIPQEEQHHASSLQTIRDDGEQFHYITGYDTVFRHDLQLLTTTDPILNTLLNAREVPLRIIVFQRLQQHTVLTADLIQNPVNHLTLCTLIIGHNGDNDRNLIQVLAYLRDVHFTQIVQNTGLTCTIGTVQHHIFSLDQAAHDLIDLLNSPDKAAFFFGFNGSLNIAGITGLTIFKITLLYTQ